MFTSNDPIIVAIACPLFLIGALSDWFDGWYARRYKSSSRFGVFIDPLADKFLIGAALIAFVEMSIVPGWMVLTILFRDLGTTFLRLFANSHKMDIKTSESAKLKTFMQFAFIAYIQLIIFSLSLNLFPEWDGYLEDLLYSDITIYSFFLLTLLTIWTLIEYILENRPVFKKLFGL